MTAQLAQCRLYYHCMSVLTPQVSLSLSLHMFDALSFQLIYIWVIRVPRVFIPDVLHFLRTDERYSFRVCMNLIGGVCCDCWKLDWWQHVTHFSDNWRDWLVFETFVPFLSGATCLDSARALITCSGSFRVIIWNLCGLDMSKELCEVCKCLVVCTVSVTFVLAQCLISEPRLDMFIQIFFFFFPRSHFCLLSFCNSLACDSQDKSSVFKVSNINRFISYWPVLGSLSLPCMA